jgi:circadian clock protein KaiC
VEETTDINISSLMDSWLLLRDIESNGERNRGLFVIKSRGMANSNQVREFHMTSQGVQLKDIYIGKNGILTGSSRRIQELSDKDESEKLHLQIENLQQELKRKQQAKNALIELARIESLSEETELKDKLMNLKQQLKYRDIEAEVIKKSRKI